MRRRVLAAVLARLADASNAVLQLDRMRASWRGWIGSFHVGLRGCSCVECVGLLRGQVASHEERDQLHQPRRAAHSDHLYCQQPHQSIITGHLRNIFEFRKLQVPKPNKSLKLPPLYHRNFFKKRQQSLTPTHPQIQIKASTFPHTHTSNSRRLQSINWHSLVQLRQMGRQIQHQTSNQMPVSTISQIQPTYPHYQRTHCPSNGRLQHRPTIETHGKLQGQLQILPIQIQIP